jgi:hypothetical protein
MRRKISTFFVVLLSIAAGVAAWAALRFTAPHLIGSDQSADSASAPSRSTAELWDEAVAKVKEDRGEIAGTTPIEIPEELQHYSDRRWFLGTQVAEVHKHNLATYQDYLDLAAKLQNGELVGVPAVTETYVLYGVGQIANDRPLSRYEDGQNVELLNEQQLREEISRLETSRSTLSTEIAGLNQQLAGLKRRDRAQRAELQKQIAGKQEELRSNEEYKRQLSELYEKPENRAGLFSEYESLQSLAKDFRGRSFDLNNPADRQTLKVTLLSSLRPQALKVMEEVATAYHQQFKRPLPVSSLVRPEQYQRALRKRNRSATNIETPPHSTGLAFDIDYRYMSVAEQNFVMANLARLKQAGRIEVLRERTANYHVFVFIDGTRPSDELVTASLEEVGAGGPETDHPAKSARVTSKSKAARGKTKPKRTQRPRTSPKRRRR